MARSDQRRSNHHDVALALREVLKADRFAVRELAARLGLGVNDITALQHLTEGPLGPTDLADRLGLTTASTSLLLDRLEDVGHIWREPHPRDGRRKIVVLTDRSRGLVLEALQPLTTALDRAAADLTEDHADAVISFLTVAATLMRDYSAGGADGSVTRQ
ncbi:DNA-binding transcriptional regulator, MarR family [Quadrisphaera granulorum]|uniref:DNA-binding MarR family transcriptional regulator n=1 Tax=Quadrisphaera granulorum TaxID=317664 RepID=A0A316ADF6_9ACTN|nr:MarR family transcriptional regulator [Quadrisphaera granulorum]PWJ54914.1 DNA-binding MarR family transcriptional regulator [Quadrisphaera granulorum]SZE95860.1 DNA-binding transcriptional regulator, MarR family [Quadrisphaera granulorum]